jgi:protein MpaA
VLGAALGGAGLYAADRVAGMATSPIWAATAEAPASRSAPSTANRWWERRVAGESVEGRSIELFANETSFATTSVMVIAAVHGDERATVPIAEAIIGVPLPDHVNGYVIPCVNPDGWDRGTRESANGTDLNRNFPYGWWPRDGGVGPASEPETQAVMAAVSNIRPAISVFVHQPYGYVGPIHRWAVPQARAWADATDLPLQVGVMQHGGAETWVAYELGLLSILVEVPRSEPTDETITQHRAGYTALLATL